MVSGFISSIDMSVSASGTVVDCFDDAFKNDPQCIPSRGRDLQGLVVNIVYYVWILGGTGFVLIGMYIGYQYMTSGSDSQKKGELAKRGSYFVISIILFFASQPIAAFMMNLFVTNSSDCYTSIKDTPGFTFFFADVCTGNSGVVADVCAITNKIECGNHPDGFYCEGASLCIPKSAKSWIEERGSCATIPGVQSVQGRAGYICDNKATSIPVKCEDVTEADCVALCDAGTPGPFSGILTATSRKFIDLTCDCTPGSEACVDGYFVE